MQELGQLVEHHPSPLDRRFCRLLSISLGVFELFTNVLLIEELKLLGREFGARFADLI